MQGDPNKIRRRCARGRLIEPPLPSCTIGSYRASPVRDDRPATHARFGTAPPVHVSRERRVSKSVRASSHARTVSCCCRCIGWHSANRIPSVSRSARTMHADAATTAHSSSRCAAARERRAYRAELGQRANVRRGRYEAPPLGLQQRLGERRRLRHEAWAIVNARRPKRDAAAARTTKRRACAADLPEFEDADLPADVETNLATLASHGHTRRLSSTATSRVAFASHGRTRRRSARPRLPASRSPLISTGWFTARAPSSRRRSRRSRSSARAACRTRSSRTAAGTARPSARARSRA